MNRRFPRAVCCLFLLALLPQVSSADTDTLWTRVFDPLGAGGYGEPVGIVVEDTHSVYMVGTYPSSLDGDPTITTVRFRQDGTLAWYDQLVCNRGAHARDIRLHPHGGVVVTGDDPVEGLWSRIRTVRYDSAGNRTWEREFSADSNHTAAFALAVDHHGNSFVGGSSEDAGGDGNLVVLKYDVTGGLAWEAWYDDTAYRADDWASAVAVDSAGSVYAAGPSNVRVGNSATDVGLLLKFTPQGDLAWKRHYLSPDTQATRPLALEVDSAGDVYMLSTASQGLPACAAVLCKYGSGGNEHWTRRWQDPGRFTVAKALAVDDSCNAYVLASPAGGSNSDDVVVLKYRPDGDTAWTAWFADSLYDRPNDLALSPSKGLYVCGLKSEPSEARPALMLRFDDTGRLTGSHQLQYGEGIALGVNEAGRAFVAGMLDIAPSAGREWGLVTYTETGDAHDVGCVAIVAPKGRADSGTAVTPVAWVHNYGTITESYPVRMSIGASYEQVVQVTGHPPRQDVRVEFPDWTPTMGNFAVVCSTGLSNDPRRDNDALHGSVQVGPPGIAEGNPGPGSGALLAGASTLRLGKHARIGFTVARPCRVSLSVFDIQGRRTSVLFSGRCNMGRHVLGWDGTDATGRPVGPGIYYVRLQAGQSKSTMKLALVP